MDVVFFFQAEDGIRDTSVTGVQTCALPISWTRGAQVANHSNDRAESTWMPTTRSRSDAEMKSVVEPSGRTLITFRFDRLPMIQLAVEGSQSIASGKRSGSGSANAAFPWTTGTRFASRRACSARKAREFRRGAKAESESGARVAPIRTSCSSQANAESGLPSKANPRATA